MDENMAKFHEKLKQLLAYAKKKKNVLEYQEINDFFADMEIDPDKIERIYEFLEANNVDVLRMPGSAADEVPDIDDSYLDGEETEEINLNDPGLLNVPEGIGTDDPVRMYLKENGYEL